MTPVLAGNEPGLGEPGSTGSGTGLARVRRFVVWLRQSRFVRNTALVMTGTDLAQLLSFALAPVISRLFSPADFGVSGAFASVAGIVTAGATLEYTQAIMLPPARRDALQLFLLSCLAAGLVGVACLGLGFASGPLLSRLFKTGEFWVVGLLALATMAGGFNAACQAWCIRSKAFKRTSAAQVVRTLTAGTLQTGAGLIGAGPAGLIAGDVAADVVAGVTMGRALLGEWREIRRDWSWSHLKAVAWEYRDFPFFAATQNVVNALSSGLPVLLLTLNYGLATAGAYAMAVRALTVPLNLVSRALRQVLFQKAGERHQAGQPLSALFVRTTAGLSGLALIPAALFLGWGPSLFTLVFGSQWLEAGQFARSLVVWLAVAFCNLPAVILARMMRIQRELLAYDLALLLVRSLILLWGGRHWDAATTLWVFAVAGAVMNAILVVAVGGALLRREGGLTWARVRACLGSAPVGPADQGGRL